MNLDEVMQELEALGKERTKKIYISNGAHEPLFGVATGAMKPMAKRIKAMTEADFDRWIDAAYFYMISDFIVAVTLAETDIAQEVSDKWIASGDELKMSAGWSCYCWLLGSRKDSEFSENKLTEMLERVKRTIHESPERTKYSMNNFLYTVATSYQPLHDQAVETAKAVGPVEVNKDMPKSKLLNASENIQKAVEKGRTGFKRKYVRC